MRLRARDSANQVGAQTGRLALALGRPRPLSYRPRAGSRQTEIGPKVHVRGRARSGLCYCKVRMSGHVFQSCKQLRPAEKIPRIELTRTDPPTIGTSAETLIEILRRRH